MSFDKYIKDGLFLECLGVSVKHLTLDLLIFFSFSIRKKSECSIQCTLLAYLILERLLPFVGFELFYNSVNCRKWITTQMIFSIEMQINFVWCRCKLSPLFPQEASFASINTFISAFLIVHMSNMSFDFSVESFATF